MMQSSHTHYLITLIGRDTQGIVAAVTTALAQADCNLEQTSMLRLGHHFTIMMMVDSHRKKASLIRVLEPVSERFGLQCHIDVLDQAFNNQTSDASHYPDADVRINVHGADSIGIIAQSTDAFAEAGLNIINLSSEVIAGEPPIYILTIAGQATQGVAALERAAEQLGDITVHIEAIDIMLG
ncbi:MAG: glycine cleavage system protein R [bacterium]